jgi:hypothetical protein
MLGRRYRAETLRRAFRAVVGCVVLLLLAAPAGSADEIDWMYDPDTVVEIRLGDLSVEELDALEAEPDEYVKGTFELRVNGVAKGVPLADVGIRRKGGFGSSRPIKTRKSGLKVRFDEFVDDQLFFGIKRLTLNNMVQDPSMLHETLTYKLYEAMELPAPRTGYAFVRLNDLAYGVFLNIETLDEISLPRWFETTQHLYEGDEPHVDVRPNEAGTFEVDEGDDEDLSDLEALIEAANDEEGDWSDGMAAVADLGQMTRHWAVERYVGHWDGYSGPAADFTPNNYYLHSDADGIFTMIPWGTDQTWGKRVEFDEEAGGLLFNFCLTDASCNALYVEGLEDLYERVPPLELDGHAAQLADLLAQYQALEEADRREYTAAEIEEGVEETLKNIRAGHNDLARWLWPPGPEAEPERQPGENQPLAGRKVWFGPTRAQGRGVITRLNVPGAGRVIQVVTARFDGVRRTACKGRRSTDLPGRVSVWCRLSRAARLRLASNPLPLRVRVVFHSSGGGSSSVTRTLTLPKRP